jgi:hypothetical protein
MWSYIAEKLQIDIDGINNDTNYYVAEAIRKIICQNGFPEIKVVDNISKS